MEVKSILSILGFMALTFLITYLWNQKLRWDRKNRKKSGQQFFFFFFGLTSAFLSIDNWLMIRSLSGSHLGKQGAIENGIARLFDWWGIYSFLVGLFLGALVLAFFYKKIAQLIKRFNLFSFYDFLKVRYPEVRKLITVISMLTLVVMIPVIFYQIKILAVFLFPAQNPFLSLSLISLSFILLFIFISNKDSKIPYLAVFTFLVLWIILGLTNLPEQPQKIFFSTPKLDVFATIVFLGLSFYLTMPRQFSSYTYRKIDIMQVPALTKSLFAGSLLLFLIIFYLIPIGGWSIGSAGITQILFLLILSFSVSLIQLFVLKTYIYASLKKYTLTSRKIASIWGSILFLAMILAAEFGLGKIQFHYSKLYLLSLTYLPILLPSFIGGILLPRFKSTNFVLSFAAGFTVWIYMVIVEDFMGMTLPNIQIPVNIITQTFFPFLASLIFYMLPGIFMRKKQIIASTLSHPEDIIIQSFLIEVEDKRVKDLFADPTTLKTFIQFFDNHTKYYDHYFLSHMIKISPDRLKPILDRLEENQWIYRKKDFFRYKKQEKELEENLTKMVISYHTVENLFRQKVEEDFNDYKKSIIQRAEELDKRISTLSLLNEVSQEFSKVFNFETLYKKVTELCVNNLDFEGAEVFLIEKAQEEEHYKYTPTAMFYSNYRHLMISLDEYGEKVQQDQHRQDIFKRAIDRKKLVLNNPNEIGNMESLPEEYSAIAFFPVFQDGEPFAMIQAGYSTEDMVISSEETQKLDFLVNNLSQSVIIISLYESLEDKIAQRTAELQKTNQDLTQFNEKLQLLNKEIKREMIAASAIQKAILPEEFPYAEYINIGSRLKAMPDPTLTEEERKKIEISGDYYDVFDIFDGKVGILIADVTGHGIPSALITTMAKISFYTHSIAGGTTADICDRVNKDIFDAIGVGDTGFYVTVFFCIYDTNTGKLQYTNGGHHKGIIIRKDSDQQEELDTQGFFIGSFEGAEYEYDEAYLGEGDKLILYTDGIVELRNPDGEFYEEIFYKRLSEKNELSPQELVNSIFEEMEEFRKDYPIKDDSTLLVIETNTVPHPAPDKEKKTVSSEKKESPEQDKRFVDAIKLFNQKKFTPELEKEIDSLLEKPKAPDILYYMKGVLLAKKGQFKEALKYFEKSREVNSNHVPTLNYLGFVHFKLKDYQRAADYWKKVLEINPDMKSAQKNLDVVNKLL